MKYIIQTLKVITTPIVAILILIVVLAAIVYNNWLVPLYRWVWE